jgi:exportin-1
LLETAENHPQLIAGLDYLIQISYVDDNEVFKTCLDYWNYFVPDVYSTTMDPTGQFSFGQNPAAQRKALHAKNLSKLRLLMISRMAKPEEVGGGRLSLQLYCVLVW